MKPTTAEHVGASSGTSVVEKVLMGGGGKKGVERRICGLAQFACFIGYVSSSKKLAHHS